eukprot:jgi/Bigna1/85104/estExt_fgenesh1_pg.C_20174
MQRHDGHSSAHEMMKDIPSGVWQLVMNYLSSRDLCKNLAPVCKRFRTESERNDQWRPRVLARWQFVTEDFVLRSKETKVAVWKATFVQLSSQCFACTQDKTRREFEAKTLVKKAKKKCTEIDRRENKMQTAMKRDKLSPWKMFEIPCRTYPRSNEV